MRSTTPELLLQQQFSMQFVAHQDAILTKYHTLLVLFDIGVVLGLAAVSYLFKAHPLGHAFLVGSLLGLHLYARRGMLLAIAFREKDVDFAQIELLLCEARMGLEQRSFTRFKIYQERDALKMKGREETFLSEAQEEMASREAIEAAFFGEMGIARRRTAMLSKVFLLFAWGIGVGSLFSSLLQTAPL